MMRTYILLGASIVMLIFSTCDSVKHDICFYHWKTDVDLTSEEVLLLKEVSSSTLYTRFFDVSWVEEKQNAFPTATVQFKHIDTTVVKKVIPVVYLTNEVFEHIQTPVDIAQFSDQVFYKIMRIWNKNLSKTYTLHEIQFDCDWTEGTKEAYFSFLRQIKSQTSEKINNPLLSATIRLHQVKYKERTGVPPVDKGVIMFYNVGNVVDFKESNSILEIEKVKRYIASLESYSLPYDVALPTFSWGVVFRNHKFVDLINDITPIDFEHDFVKVDGYYVAQQFTDLGGTFVYEGDKIRLEQPSLKQLKLLSGLISKHSKYKEYKNIFYHIGAQTTHDLGANALQEISK